MLREDLRTERVDLALPADREPGSFKTKIKATDSGEK